MRTLSFKRRSKENGFVNDPEDSNLTNAVRLGAASKQGPSHLNEDRVFEIDDLKLVDTQVPARWSEKMAFVSVFDGHGGGGCSQYLSENLHLKVLANPSLEGFTNAQTALLDAFKACDDEWSGIAEQTSEFSGSCALASLIWDLDVVVAHAGDCRAVARMGKKTLQITKDHRPCDPAEKARIYSAGGFIKNGRVMGALAPSRGFGDLDIKRKAPSPEVIISEPDISCIRMEYSQKGEPSFIVFATDGVWDCMPMERACDVVAKSLLKHNDEEAAATKLCEIALELNTDDCSAVVVVFPYAS